MLVDRLEQLSQRYHELDRLLADRAVASDQDKLRQYGKEYHGLTTVMAQYKAFKEVLANIASTKELVQDPDIEDELLELAEIELEELQANQTSLEEELQKLLIPKDPEDSKDVICEIRAGTGGDEACIFAGDLYRMYVRFVQRKGWKMDIVNTSEGSQGGVKEIIFEVIGRGVYQRFKHESGVHRVQRVPLTEAQGRIHTSTATVAVLPQAEEIDVQIRPEELRIDIFHAGGPGGQNVNKVATAVRMVHLPTGIVAICQDERSQLKNRQKAMTLLRSRILERELLAQAAETSAARKQQVGSGERSEKVRTYNFPQGRMTDHRINLTLYKLNDIMDGDLEEVFETLKIENQKLLMNDA